MKKLLIILCLLATMLAFGCQGTGNPEPVSPDSKLVCLFFDDCFLNQYEVALPVLLKHDFKATFGVITGHIGTGHGLWEYMDEEELKVLDGHGMDIACHTRTHPDLTGNLTDEQLREEIVYPKTHLENMGFRISTMVYPYYQCDSRVIKFVMESGYTCARAGWSKAREYDPRRGDPKARFNIPSWQITSQGMDEFKTIVNGAGRYSVVSLVYHFIVDDGPKETSTPVDNFKEQMDYLKEAGFTVVLMPDLFRE